jgi:RNA polymerase sigma-70 factor (ECF subfamily)
MSRRTAGLALVSADTSALIANTRDGDRAALGALYDLYATTLFRTAYRLTNDVANAEDAVHDCFVGLPEALRHYEDRGALGAWLRSIVVRLVLMRRRAESRRQESPLTLLEPDVEATPPDVGAEIVEARRAIAALPASLRDVVVLHRVEGYSHEEIGALLGISAGASRVRLTRAIQQLRRLLHADD